MKAVHPLAITLLASLAWTGPAAAQEHAAHDAHTAAEPQPGHVHRHAAPPDPAPTAQHAEPRPDPHAGHDDAHAGHHDDHAPATDPHAMHGMAHGGEAGTTSHAGHAATATGELRSPDYSDGLAPSPMHMPADARFGMFTMHQLEQWQGRDERHGQRWELAGWYGSDRNRALLRSEGEREAHHHEGNVEALWSRAVAPFWNTELGLHHDFGDGGGRDWLAFGVAGLAPYFFDLRATAYLASGGHTALRLEAGYELLLTQRLILEPGLQLEIRGKADPARGVASGLAESAAGLRLRYEIRRELAPYIGVLHTRHRGAAGARRHDRQWVAGVRFWF